MTTGKGKQVIKCEKSEARLGSPFCSVSFPNAAAQLWPSREDGGGPTKAPCCWTHLRAHSSLSGSSKPAMSCSTVITSHRLEKLPPSCDTLYALGLLCPGADVVAPGAWSAPKSGQEKGQEGGRGNSQDREMPLEQVSRFK